jgi:hypothetical protein
LKRRDTFVLDHREGMGCVPMRLIFGLVLATSSARLQHARSEHCTGARVGGGGRPHGIFCFFDYVRMADSDGGVEKTIRRTRDLCGFFAFSAFCCRFDSKGWWCGWRTFCSRQISNLSVGADDPSARVEKKRQIAPSKYGRRSVGVDMG